MFRLLTPASASPAPDTPTLTLSSGHTLTLTPPEAPLPNSSTAPYTCISYAWGPDHIPNPFISSAPPISTRTLPVLTTTLLATVGAPQPIWIDALCVPPKDPSRRACLVSMSLLYRHAARIVIVLSAETADFLYTPEADVTDAMIAALNDDVWVTRAWTYQEFANNSPDVEFGFLAEGAGDKKVVSAWSLLNKMGTVIRDYYRRYPEQHPTGPEKKWSHARRMWPNVDAFMDILADYLISDAEERSALCAIACIDRRTQSRPEDRYYSIVGMVGGVDAERLEALQKSLTDPAKVFMTLCEEKGDYSFIFVAAAVREGWRPSGSVDFKAVLAWNVTGLQHGSRDAEGRLILNAISELRPAIMSDSARDFIMATAIGEYGLECAVEWLRDLGFNGHGKLTETENGLFFAQTEWTELPEAEVVVLVPTKLWYVWGAPAILAVKDAEGCRFVSSGLFVGPTCVVNCNAFKRDGSDVKLV